MNPWYIVTFENRIETQFIASMNFDNELYNSVKSYSVKSSDVKYFYKHTDEKSIYYLSPEIAVITHELINKYNAALLLNAPDISNLEVCVL
jgi:hypothetical protein